MAEESSPESAWSKTTPEFRIALSASIATFGCVVTVVTNLLTSFIDCAITSPFSTQTISFMQIAESSIDLRVIFFRELLYSIGPCILFIVIRSNAVRLALIIYYLWAAFVAIRWYMRDAEFGPGRVHFDQVGIGSAFFEAVIIAISAFVFVFIVWKLFVLTCSRKSAPKHL